MGEALTYGERILTWVYRQHFRIAPAVFWLMLVGGAAVAPFLSFWPACVAVFVALLGVMGVYRWRLHRRRLHLIVLPQPVTVDPSDRRACRAQELVMESLATSLTSEEASWVHPIPARVGPTEIRLADAIRRRLRSPMIVVGRIDNRADGGWSLFSGIVKEPERDVIHLDWHTRERLPARAQWDVWFDRFSPTRDVQDVAEPLLMSGEVSAIVRSFAGFVASRAGDLERAEAEFRAAIDASDNADSAVIDDVRCELAKVLMRLNRRDDARELLRQRARGENPSPELLRTFAGALGDQPGDIAAEFESDGGPYPGRDEALQALRAAAAVRGDPKRPMSLYNLSAILSDADVDERAEASKALEEAMRTSRFYRRAWYARRALGAMHWHEAERAREAGDHVAAREEFERSARWYSAAIRTRPHFRLFWRDSFTISIFARFPPSAVLHGNAEDAHAAAGHRLRARWHHLRAERARRRRLKVAEKNLKRQRWEGAYANYDFAVMGRSDLTEAYAAVMRAVALQQMGDRDAANAAFDQADRRFPAWALPIRAALVSELDIELPNGLPGGGPTDEDGIRAELRRRGSTPSPNDDEGGENPGLIT